MNRRHFTQKISATLGGAGLLGANSLLSKGLKSQDPYGGWTGKQFEATGYFRVEKDDRWWMVTPEGNAFLSFGINHFVPDLFRQPFSQAAWQKRLGIEDLADDKQFYPAIKEWLFQTCANYGFNTLGVHTSLRVTNTPRAVFPYLQPIKFVEIPHWKGDIPDENFLDVFSDEFAARCDRLAKETAAPLRDDSNLIGYSMTDCPLFTEEDLRERPDVIGGARRESRIGWPRRLRNFGADAAGKQAYVKTMQEIYYSKIASFNKTYGTRFDSFDALASAADWRPDTDLSNANETRDNIIFLQACVDAYYRIAKEAIHRYDPNHLFFGDKLNANTDSLDTVLPVTAKHTDVLLYQMYARYEVQEPGLDRWKRLADLPVINGDSAFTMVTDTMPRPYGPVADTLDQRVEWTEEFFRKAFARPEFVGWHYCGLVDATNLIPRKKERQHSGLVDSFGEPYAALEKTLKACAEEMYKIGVTG
ncbi:MAG: hypothetical protein P1U58_09165 [Verrucomicrobiales bacterium]|nr:hypothetical protein [Verrucomicrobiales bacterium]